MKLRILLAEDDEFARCGLRQMIRSRTPHQIVGEAANGEEAVRLTREKKPDMIIMDAVMPGMDGVEATRRIVNDHPDVRILVLSAHDEEKWVRSMFQAGARGFILKESGMEVLKEAVEAVAAGQFYVDEGMITDVVMRDYVRQITQSGSPLDTLTPREREVLQLIGQGRSAKDIAGSLHVGIRTIETHYEHLMAKLDVHSAVGLASRAAELGLDSWKSP